METVAIQRHREKHGETDTERGTELLYRHPLGVAAWRQPWGRRGFGVSSDPQQLGVPRGIAGSPPAAAGGWGAPGQGRADARCSLTPPQCVPSTSRGVQPRALGADESQVPRVLNTRGFPLHPAPHHTPPECLHSRLPSPWQPPRHTWSPALPRPSCCRGESPQRRRGGSPPHLSTPAV